MGCFAIKHLVENDAHRPYVTFSGVSVSIENFGTHVHGAANKRLVDLLQLRAFLVVLGESEVSDFVGFVFHENVCGFEISVDD